MIILPADLKASIDIHDNPLDSTTADSYAPLRPYWNHITLRAPFVLPNEAPLKAPTFSHPAGFYDQWFHS